ncbi:hypothetical protein NITLEN_80098 [Nitrospira lenta]|uniref:Uncharacterized protein n=1 Tax=Nitrospira lenta TaxID=1436998 RepID=A0A330LC61_9BACT|nr:hypothetical protein NITLEN_80098 [Nitrospira lenta]
MLFSKVLTVVACVLVL